MLIVANVKKDKRLTEKENDNDLFGIDKLNVPRSLIPAVTHIDYSARIQTVHKETNPIYHNLISSFKDKTGCALVVNTSFNVRGEPIVNSPKDAYICFMNSNIDILVIGNLVFFKKEQTSLNNKEVFKQNYGLD